MLDHRVYRAAFLPALVAALVLAFSLEDVPRGQTTRLAPLAFDAQRAFTTMRDLAERFGQRRPGGPEDQALADLVAERFAATDFAVGEDIERLTTTERTIDGEAELETVIATRQGLSQRSLLVIAHRDASADGSVAELSGTAVLLELARLFADRELSKTIVLASVSGGSGGYAGAREAARAVDAPVDAALVLGDLATETQRRPMVLGWSNGADPAAESLTRTVAAALRAEADIDPGRAGALSQLIRRAVPLTISEQGEVNRELGSAVLISASSEIGPTALAPVSAERFEAFGRATLRALYAGLDARGERPFEPSDGVVALKRLVPTWSISLLVFTLLLPVLATTFDGLFRARRKGIGMGRWLAWALLWAAPVLLAWLWARALGGFGAVRTLPAPTAGGELALDAAGWAAMASTVLLVLGGWFAVARRSPSGVALATGAAATATGLILGALVLAVWIFNPYAAAVLVPAAHAWLLATVSRRRWLSTLAFVAGLLAPLVVVAYYARAWRLGPAEGIWTSFNLVSGGALGPGAALTVAGFAGMLAAVIAIMRAGRMLAKSTPAADDSLVTRGPSTYAGPGSLGGTESALRR